MDDTLSTPIPTATARPQAAPLREAGTSAEASQQADEAEAGGLPAAHAVARGLGWFSIALGLAELLAPDATARATGSNNGKTLLQAAGMREIVSGIGLLTARDPTPWLWARVGGDALDIAALASDLGASNERRRNTAWSLIAVMGITAIDVWAAQAASRVAAASAAPVRDYSDRVGMALPPDEMRGKARDALAAAPDMQTPSALRPYTLH
jgi:hypothetical protein